MAGESQQEPVTGAPDPSVFTSEAIDRAKISTEETIDAKFAAIVARLNGIDRATELLHEDFTRFPTEVQNEVGHLKEMFDIRLAAGEEIAKIREEYRRELKADAKEALATAMTAAEKAVQAALAAAEKARDQQTIASQLATDKAEKAFVEALAQQQITFTNAIANIIDGLNEVKAGLAEIRTQQLTVQENRVDNRAKSGNVGLWIGVAAAVGFGVIMMLIAVASLIFSMNSGTP